jgi:DNA-binding MarR family transcriptional regulator
VHEPGAVGRPVLGGDTRSPRHTGEEAAEALHDPRPLTTYLLKQTESAIRSHMDTVMRPHGLTTMQYTALTVLQHREDLSSAQLARRSFVKPQTMHEMVLTLERQGLIMRYRSPHRSTALLVRLTPEGREKLSACQADVLRIERQMIESLSGAELAMLRALLERCHQSLSRPLSRDAQAPDG